VGSVVQVCGEGYLGRLQAVAHGTQVIHREGDGVDLPGMGKGNVRPAERVGRILRLPHALDATLGPENAEGAHFCPRPCGAARNLLLAMPAHAALTFSSSPAKERPAMPMACAVRPPAR